MIWLFLALGSAITLSLADVLCKKLSQTFSYWTVAWIRYAFSTPVFLTVLIINGVSAPPLKFWFYLLMLIPLEMLASLLYLQAIQISPLSLTIPFLAFTPVFLLFIPGIILGEKLSAMGIVGVLIVVVGAYLLNIHESKTGVLKPVLAILKEKGSWLMLLVALIYSFTATMGKFLILMTNPLFFGSVYFPSIGIFLTPLFLHKQNISKDDFSDHFTYFILVGILIACMAIFHYLAIEMAEVAYVISVKRTSLIFSTIFGGLIFHEHYMRERLLGCVVMFVGVIIISLWG